MPTPLFICGAECGVAAIGATQPAGTLRHWSTFGATVFHRSLDGQGVLRPGPGRYAYQFTPGGTTTYQLYHTFSAVIASPAVMVARFRIYWQALPAGNVIETLFSEPNGLAGIRWNNGHIEAWAGAATTVVAGSFTPVAGVWYRIDVRITRGTTASTEWQVDGVDQTTASKTGQSAASIAGFDLGHNASGTGGSQAAGGQWLIDDLIVSGTTGDYPIGDGAVVGLVPNRDGTHSFTAGDFGYDAAAGDVGVSDTTVYQRLDDLLSGITDFIRQKVLRTTAYIEIGTAPLPALLFDPTAINGLVVVSSHHSEGTAGNAQSLRIEDGATESAVFASVDYSDATIDINSKVYATAPSTSAAWTRAKINALLARWGFSGDVSPNPDFDGLCLEVDYVPPPVPAAPYSSIAGAPMQPVSTAVMRAGSR